MNSTTKGIDSHQHFWKYDPPAYPWINESMSVLKRDFLPEDLAPLLASVGFAGAVAVQARQVVEETEWLLALSEKHDFIRAVVGWVDLRAPDIATVLRKYSAYPKLRGVRHVVQDEPDDRFMLSPEFQRGTACLHEVNLTYDLLIFPKQLPAAVSLAERFPAQPFVLDHIGKPSILNREIEPWKTHLERLARCPNVYCKLSGMVTEAALGKWQPDEFYPYLDMVIAAFGTERVMIGSDWPVCTLSGEYVSVVGIVMEYIRQFSTEAQTQILGGNCSRFYGI
jgi:L-fuconolactonase